MDTGHSIYCTSSKNYGQMTDAKDAPLTIVIQWLFRADAAAWQQECRDIGVLRRRLPCTDNQHRLLSATSWWQCHLRTTNWQLCQLCTGSRRASGRHVLMLDFMHHFPVLQELSFNVCDRSSIKRICTRAHTVVHTCTASLLAQWNLEKYCLHGCQLTAIQLRTAQDWAQDDVILSHCRRYAMQIFNVNSKTNRYLSELSELQCYMSCVMWHESTTSIVQFNFQHQTT